MKLLLLAFATTVFGAAMVVQSGQSMLERHSAALKDAKTLVIKVTVQPIGGSSSEETITLSKPGMFKVESSDGFIVSDGKTIWEYTKSGNTYTETAWSADSARKFAMKSELWAWGAFFAPDILKDAAATAGSKRRIKGKDVVELEIVTKTDPATEGTLYINPSTGMAMGASVKARKPGDPDILVMATDIESGKDVPATMFAFTAPDGAKKVDPNAAPTPETVTYAQVQAIFNANCMPCHNSQNMKGGADLSSYSGVMAAQGEITPGDPDNSNLVKVLDGRGMPKMPKNRAPLSKQQIDTIRAWIKAGAKDGQ